MKRNFRITWTFMPLVRQRLMRYCERSKAISHYCTETATHPLRVLVMTGRIEWLQSLPCSIPPHIPIIPGMQVAGKNSMRW
jgi:hypothetical protein